jgi:hypothetical protein
MVAGGPIWLAASSAGGSGLLWGHLGALTSQDVPTPLPLAPAELHRCAMGLRLLAENVRVNAGRAETTQRQEDLEMEAQILQELAVKVQRMASAARRG